MKTHFNLAYIRNTIAPVDLALENYRSEIADHPDPDTFGLIDQYEQFFGVGFAVCQTFLSSVHKGENKGAAFLNGSLGHTLISDYRIEGLALITNQGVIQALLKAAAYPRR